MINGDIYKKNMINFTIDEKNKLIGKIYIPQSY